MWRRICPNDFFRTWNSAVGEYIGYSRRIYRDSRYWNRIVIFNGGASWDGWKVNFGNACPIWYFSRNIQPIFTENEIQKVCRICTSFLIISKIEWTTNGQAISILKKAWTLKKLSNLNDGDVWTWRWISVKKANHLSACIYKGSQAAAANREWGSLTSIKGMIKKWVIFSWMKFCMALRISEFG